VPTVTLSDPGALKPHAQLRQPVNDESRGRRVDLSVGERAAEVEAADTPFTTRAPRGSRHLQGGIERGVIGLGVREFVEDVER
jgi:hypothetical protein